MNYTELAKKWLEKNEYLRNTDAMEKVFAFAQTLDEQEHHDQIGWQDDLAKQLATTGSMAPQGPTGSMLVTGPAEQEEVNHI